jgi:uncharacterized protein
MKQLKLIPQNRVRFLKNAILIDEKILVISDVHIGYEEYIASSGLLRLQMKDIYEIMDCNFRQLEKGKVVLENIVILGDLKHEFGEISESEWRDTLKFLDYLSKKCDEVILIKGNHDNIIGPIASKRKVKLVDFWKYEDICFFHGNKWFDSCDDCDMLILGHIHPAITLDDDYKKEKYKCFLQGKWKKKKIIVLPSLGHISFGYELSKMIDLDKKKKGFCFLPKKDIIKLNVLIYNDKEDKVYDFGVLKKLVKKG